MGGELGAFDMSFEEKFGNGLIPGSGIFPSSLPSTSKFVHRFCPEYIWEELGAVVFPWEEKFRCNFPPAR